MEDDDLKVGPGKSLKAINTSSIGMAIFDLDGKYIDVDETYSQILGIPKKRLLGSEISELMEGEGQKKIPEELDEFFTRGITEGKREFHTHDKDVVLSYINTLLYDDNEKPIGIISLVRDITEIKAPEKMVEDVRKLPEHPLKKHQEHLIINDSIYKKIPIKRRIFDPFKTIFEMMGRKITYEIEDRSLKTPKSQGFFEKIIQKSLDSDDFMYEFDTQTFWRRKYEDYDE